MSKQFNGTINLDIRDSVPDWAPYAEPKAKTDAPNILYIVMDDTGFGAWEMYGGKIKMPNLKRIVDRGLMYTNFHTTALCSPTRSSLLNGRNATSNGMSCIEEATSGFPGSNGRIPFENALLPEVLKDQGYNTFAAGKWHMAPEEESNMASSKRHWPIGRGFDRYYGFLGGETDQWYPDIVYDNHLIEPPYKPNMKIEVTENPEDIEAPEDSYHFSKDLTDKAIMFIQDSQAIAPDKPWMLYYSPGANHAPHQIWPEMILKYKYNTTLNYNYGVDPLKLATDSFETSSVFSEGYEEYRQQTLNMMKEKGIFDCNVEASEINPHGEGALDTKRPGDDANIIGVPEGKEWPQTEYVRPWASLERNEKALFIRMAEIYAAYSTYTDEQIGRLFDYLEDTDQMDNTIIVAVSDNGASGEGGPNGSVNENLFFNDIPDDFEENFKQLQQLGTDKTYNHYPSGWAWGFDAPFKYWKRWAGYEGGAATPFMICGPGVNRPTADGCVTGSAIRKQYIHAVDLVPTLYECLDITPPDVVKGYSQNPIEGISFKYTFAHEYGREENRYPYKLEPDDRPGPEGWSKKVKETQFYSMLGTRGIWHRGWHACTVHAPTPSDWSNFDSDVWELYCMDGEGPQFKSDNEAEGYHFAADPTQLNNLAALIEDNNTPPEIRAYLNKKLEGLKNRWFSEAGKLNGMPLDDRSTSAVLNEPRPQLTDPPFAEDDGTNQSFDYTYYPGGTEVPEAVAVNVRTRSYAISAFIDMPPKTLGIDNELIDIIAAPEGVLFAHGGRFGGHSFYLHKEDSKLYLCYVYNWLGRAEQKIRYQLTSDDFVIPNRHRHLLVKVKFRKSHMILSPDEAAKYGKSTVGNIELYINGKRVDHELIDYQGIEDTEPATDVRKLKFITQPGKFALTGEGLNIARDGGQPVSSDYQSPGELKRATVRKVKVRIYNDAEDTDHEKEYQGMMWRD